MNYKKLFTALLTIAICYGAMGQNEGVSIKSTMSPPNPGAMLDVESSNKGVLIPRVALQAINQTAPISSSGTLEKGLMVFNTNASYTTNNTPTGPSNGLQGTGFYYWDASRTKWIKMGQGFDIPKVTYEQMQAMLPFLTYEDMGMMVFVTTGSVNTYLDATRSCTAATEVFGMWYLSSYYCNSNLPIWVRIKTDFGNPVGPLQNCTQRCGIAPPIDN